MELQNISNRPSIPRLRTPPCKRITITVWQPQPSEVQAYELAVAKREAWFEAKTRFEEAAKRGKGKAASPTKKKSKKVAKKANADIDKTLAELLAELGPEPPEPEPLPPKELAEVIVHKPPASIASLVAGMIAEDFGDTVLRIFATPEVDENTGEDLLADVDAKSFGSAALMKSAVALGVSRNAIERIREAAVKSPHGVFARYFEAMLCGDAEHGIRGCIEFQGYRFSSMAELDEAGFGMHELIECFWAAVEIAIYPSLGVPSIDDGSPVRSVAPQKMAPSPAQPTTISSVKGATARAGRSAQTPTSLG